MLGGGYMMVRAGVKKRRAKGGTRLRRPFWQPAPQEEEKQRKRVSLACVPACVRATNKGGGAQD